MQIIKFSSLWCMSCIITNQIINKLSKEYIFELIDYDYDVDKEKVQQYNVGDILPVLIFVDDKGNEIKRLVGEQSKKDLLKVFDEVGVNLI